MAIRIAIMTAAVMIAAVCILATGAFLCVALYYALAMVLIPPLAALCTAGILLVLALIIIAIGSALSRAAARKARLERERRPGNATGQLGLELGRMAGEYVASYVSKNPTRVLVGSLVAGFAFGVFPRLRSFLMSFLKRK